MIVGDGMGDCTYKELGNKTPMQVARTPELDKLTQKGICGMVYPVGEGMVPSSTVAHRALLGDWNFLNHLGRGLFAALSTDVELSDSDIVFRCDLSTIDNNRLVKDERAGRIQDTVKIQSLINSLSPLNDIAFEYQAIKEYRGVLIIHDNQHNFKGINVSDLFAMEGSSLKECVPFDNDSVPLANFVNKLYDCTREVLQKQSLLYHNKTTAITLRGAARTSQLTNGLLSSKSIKGGFVTGIPDVYGVLKYCGLESLTDLKNIDLSEIKAKEYIDPILKQIDQYDLFVINIGSFDAASHDGDLKRKIKYFEQLDEMIKYFESKANEEITIILTADHCTLCKTKQHSFLPVPVVISPSNEGCDEAGEFSEDAFIKSGVLGTLENGNVIARIMTSNLEKGFYVS
nr:hypothetical protein [Lactobacillus colini]